MSSFNSIQICGYLGSDIQVRTTPAGTTVGTFSIATNSKVGGEDVTTWFRVTVWQKQAEALQEYLLKGTLVFVQGSLRTSEFTDKDGNSRTSIEVTASNIQLLGKKSEAKAASAAAGSSSAVDDESSDVPF